MSEPESAAGRPLVLHVGHEEIVIRQRYEVASILNDFLIAMWFAVGSVFFLFHNLVLPGTWLFVIGSVQLAIRPTIRLTRRIHLRRISQAKPAESARDF